MISTAITDFHAEYPFLSNFYPASVIFEGAIYPSLERAFAAAKTLDVTRRREIAGASSPGQAKRAGRQVSLRADWDDVRVAVMATLLAAKFSHAELARGLLSTGDTLLIEGNTWHDQYWGQCLCATHRDVPGANHLGEALMRLRANLRNDSPQWPGDSD